MRFSRMINVVGVHTEGELNEVITGGVLDVPGKTMFEKARYLETQGDALRQFLLYEPRARSRNAPISSCRPQIPKPAPDLSSWNRRHIRRCRAPTPFAPSPRCWNRMVPMAEPVTRLTLEAPGGLIRVSAKCADGRCENVTFRNVPCFVFGLDRVVEVEGLGTIKVDVAYGGMIYVLVDAQALGFAIDPSEAKDLVTMANASRRRQRNASGRPPGKSRNSHDQPDLFAGPMETRPDGTKTARNTVVVSPVASIVHLAAQVPARVSAVMHARKEIKAGEIFVHRSIIDTEFRGRIDEVVDIAGTPGIVPSITGRAWLTAFHQYVLDPSDPFPTGYRIGDTWPDAPSMR